MEMIFVYSIIPIKDNLQLSGLSGEFTMACLLIAYTAQNLGDDMFVDYICKRYPNIQFLIVCQPEYSYAFSKLKNLKIFHNEKELRMSLEPVKLQVLIGGSLFMEPRSQKDIYSKFVSNTQYRVYKDVPMIIIGANFGPYETELHFLLHRQWFATINYISFRDDYSYSLFKDFSHVTWAPDILFNYPIPAIKSTRTIVISCIRNDYRIGLSDYDEESYIVSLCKIAKSYINMNYRVLLASFCKKQGDDQVAKKIINRLCSEKAMLISYEGDILNFLSNILSAEYIIGTRFHSIILGWLAGIPVFPISYNTKTEAMLKCYGFNGHSSKIESVSTDFEYVDYNRVRDIKIPALSLIRESKKHFAFMDEYLNKSGDAYE